jgi:Uma2 family endonuclease
MRQLKYIPQYTATDYQKWEGDWELIDGMPYAMSPSASVPHQDLAGELIWQIRDSLKKNKSECNCRQLHETDWVVSDSIVLRPDIVVVCDSSVNLYITNAPVLIIEILSPSTASKDRFLKMEIYEEYGVKYYIIVDPASKTFIINELVNGQYRERKNSNSYLLDDKCAIELDIDSALKGIA